MTIRIRITFIATIATAIALAGAGWLLIRSVEHSQIAQLRRRAETALAAAAERLEAGDTWEAALADLPSIVFVSTHDNACVVSNPIGNELLFRCNNDGDAELTRSDDQLPPPDGTVLRTFPRGDATDAPNGIPAGAGELNPGGAAAPNAGDTLIGGVRGFEAEILSEHVGSDVYGDLTVTAIAPVRSVTSGVGSVGTMLWVAFPTLVALVAALAWWLTGRALRPVEAIRQQAEAIEGTSIDHRVPQPDGDDEIARLARTMNDMLARLDQSARARRRFVSDASHELRTPVAASRTDLEVALAEGDHADWPATARAVLAEQARLDALVADLLFLATADETAGQPSHDNSHDQTIEIEPLIAEEISRRRARPIELIRSERWDDRTAITGSSSQLSKLLAHLLDNAARHANTQVVVGLDLIDDHIAIDIDDDGPGIPHDDREQIFERFARLDDGRDRRHGGAGLGLAVARTIAHRHHGTLTASSTPTGGARLELRLPAT